jgi:hypothetical protein
MQPPLAGRFKMGDFDLSSSDDVVFNQRKQESKDVSKIQEIVVKRIGDKYSLCEKDGLDPRLILDLSDEIERERKIPHSIDGAQGIMLGMINVRKAKEELKQLTGIHDLTKADEIVTKMADKTVEFISQQGDLSEDPRWDQDGKPLGHLRQKIFNEIKSESSQKPPSTTPSNYKLLNS